MKLKAYSIIFLLFTMSAIGQTNFKLMTYNLLHYPTGTGIDRKDNIKYVLNDYQPDIFMVCELESFTGSEEIINYCLQTPDNRYAAATYTFNHSGNYPLQQMLYYNTHKFELISETFLTTYIRDINHYTLKTRTQIADTIDVYVTHLKASGGTTNENERLDMVRVMTQDLNNIPTSHYVVFAGDFNLYGSTEPAFEEITDPTNAIVLNDPINLSGNWHNNPNIRTYVTQSTHVTSDNNYVGGGLDDRFDFIILSENFFNNGHLQYGNNSYKSYGNNGNCYNRAINSNNCSGATYSTTLREHLYTASDHLPVVLELHSNSSLSVNEHLAQNNYHIIGGNIVSNQLRIFTNDKVVQIKIINSLGQIIIDKKKYSDLAPINVSLLRNGIYYLLINDQKHVKTIKFVKTD